MAAQKAKKAKTPTRKTKAGSGREVAERRRHKFVEAFLANGGNASKAAVAAGFSPSTAGVTGHKLLKHAQVRLMLEQRQNAIAQKFELTTESVMRSLAQAVHFDPRKLYNADGTLKRVIDLDDDTAMALSGLEAIESSSQSVEDGEVVYTPISTKKLKWLDKNTARDQANKILGHYNADKTPPGDPLVAATDRATKGMGALQAQFAKVLAKHSGAKP